MESSPASPMPFEYGGEDKDKKEEKGKKKSSPLRIPLPASEIHASEPKKHERLLPLFEMKEERREFGTKEDKKDATEIAVGHEMHVTEQQEAQSETPHRDLEQIHDALWTEFKSTAPAVQEPSAAERAAEAAVAAGQQAEITMPPPDSTARAETFDTIMQQSDTDGSLAKAHEALAGNDQPQHFGWDESQTVHLNAPAKRTPEDAIPAAPSAAGMAAEVAATEPDQESVRMWEEFNNAPAAQEVPAWHPESRPLDTREQFTDIMQRADMGGQFVAATSERPTVETVPQTPLAPVRTYGSFNTSGRIGTENMPQTDTPPPAPFTASEHTVHATGSEGPAWYPAQPRHATGSMLRNAAEAGLVGGALAGAGAAQTAETATALAGGAAAGAVAGGVAGHMAGEQAGRREARREMQDEANRRDERIAALTNEQRTAHEQIDRLTRAGQEQKAPAEKAAAAAAAMPAAERLHETQDTKVVHSEWVDMVVDKQTGKLAEHAGVNEFGDEFRAEQRPESEPPDPLAAALAAAQAAARTSADVTDTYQQEHGQAITHSYSSALPSGQIGAPHELPAGQGQADIGHRLAEPRSPFAAAASNPLLWVGVAVLVLAFLAAAFI